jgi:hypothetical protein
MVLAEESYIETINAYTKQQWKPLLELIPFIENAANFGEFEEGQTIADGIHTFPYWTHSDLVSKFLEIVYAIPVIIDFDWGSWAEGIRIAKDIGFNYDTIDIPTKCRLITAFVRNDRFCEGALVEVFESGLMLKILKSIENQLELGTNDGTGL